MPCFDVSRAARGEPEMFGGCDEPHSVCTETAPALAEHRAPEIKLSYESSDNEFDIGVSSARVAPPASLGLITVTPCQHHFVRLDAIAQGALC